MRLEIASEADVPAIMAIERMPGYEWFIGTFEAEEHLAYMRSADARYLVWREAGEVLAFVILFKMTNTSGVREAKRIAARDVGTGLGRRLIPAMIDQVFEDPDVNRLELDCSTANPRALRVYEREGFVREGLQREVYRMDDGSYISSALFSLLRREWQAMRGRP